MSLPDGPHYVLEIGRRELRGMPLAACTVGMLHDSYR